MKICVAGLGLIGGSMCSALKRAGHAVDGWNRSPQAACYAVENGIIDAQADGFTRYDVVFVALPPQATVDFIDNTRFKSGAIVSDICGVKGFIENHVYSVPRNFRYVGCHPMAGKEVSGIENACADLFDGASIIITRRDETDADAADTIINLSRDMGFGRAVLCTAKTHDEKIAYTSQLAHIVSNAYVKSPSLKNCICFTGGSFQDMTRIAGVDENVWASLYLNNAENVAAEIDLLVDSLTRVKEAVLEKDSRKLKSILAEGRSLFAGSEKTVSDADISVKKLN